MTSRILVTMSSCTSAYSPSSLIESLHAFPRFDLHFYKTSNPSFEPENRSYLEVRKSTQKMSLLYSIIAPSYTCRASAFGPSLRPPSPSFSSSSRSSISSAHAVVFRDGDALWRSNRKPEMRGVVSSSSSLSPLSPSAWRRTVARRLWTTPIQSSTVRTRSTLVSTRRKTR